MRLIFLLLALTHAVACSGPISSQAAIHPGDGSRMTIVKDIYYQFLNDAARFNVSTISVSVGFVAEQQLVQPNGEHWKGICFYRTRTIFLSREDFDESLMSDRKAMLYHELGHCALNQPHFESQVDLMNHLIPDEVRYNLAPYAAIMFQRSRQ